MAIKNAATREIERKTGRGGYLHRQIRSIPELPRKCSPKSLINTNQLNSGQPCACNTTYIGHTHTIPIKSGSVGRSLLPRGRSFIWLILFGIVPQVHTYNQKCCNAINVIDELLTQLEYYTMLGRIYLYIYTQSLSVNRYVHMCVCVCMPSFVV